MYKVIIPVSWIVTWVFEAFNNQNNVLFLEWRHVSFLEGRHLVLDDPKFVFLCCFVFAVLDLYNTKSGRKGG